MVARPIRQIAAAEPFDAAVGRFILMFLPDPLSVLRSVARLVLPGGVLAFQEPSWVPILALGACLPLWSKVLSCIHQTFLRSGVNPEMGLDLFRVFQEVGLPAASAAFEVGYESPSQFNREYRRFFGQPPMRDVKALRDSRLVAITAA